MRTHLFLFLFSGHEFCPAVCPTMTYVFTTGSKAMRPCNEALESAELQATQPSLFYKLIITVSLGTVTESWHMLVCLSKPLEGGTAELGLGADGPCSGESQEVEVQI
jgi:hypothetical protein